MNRIQILKNIYRLALASWLSWLDHRPRQQKIAGSIPGQSTYPDCRVPSPAGMRREGKQSIFLSHIDVALSVFLSLLSLKSINVSSGEDFIKNFVGLYSFLNLQCPLPYLALLYWQLLLSPFCRGDGRGLER